VTARTAARIRAHKHEARLRWLQPLAYMLCVAAAFYAFGLYAIARAA